ncbi:MAG TPA: hydantoinase/oxoprolinase N-terminal domain-containing protein, partial [Polyangiaceae bacterium LLY-WYZ-15_(1-7)]|nr:hydantoinase/oxoprolinase N-terminal domain-containing protein [Polyangiaceae bacterium LLY-WYZ-15_(1-7)]
MAAPMHVWIDRGGTFTDCIGRDPATGETRVAKVLSGDDAPIRGVRALLELDPDAPLPPCDVRMGTTLATNALLERKGARCVLVVQAGFGDLLALDDQTRPALFDLSARRPAPLTDEVIEVEARVDATGRELTPLNVRAVRSALEAARERGAEAVVVALLHAPAGPAHERAIAAVAREVGFEQVSCSHEASASAGLLARAQTALVDAYLTPVLRRYLARLGERLPGSRLRLMQSSGDLVEAGRFRGKDAILSGPAGGVVACARIAE